MGFCQVSTTPAFVPALWLISSITQAKKAEVTTASFYNGTDPVVPVAHGYVTGTKIRFKIPKACGMQQINNVFAAITVTSPTTFTVNIDTRSFDPFIIPTGLSPLINICAQCVPMGESNDILTAAKNRSGYAITVNDI